MNRLALFIRAPLAALIVTAAASSTVCAQSTGISFSHTPVTEATSGEVVPIEVVIEADATLAAVELRVREDGAIEWLTLPMALVSDGRWAGEIDSAFVRGEAVDYYLFAIREGEEFGATEPASAPDNHHRVIVTGPDSDSGCSTIPSRGVGGLLVPFLLSLAGVFVGCQRRR